MKWAIVKCFNYHYGEWYSIIKIGRDQIYPSEEIVLKKKTRKECIAYLRENQVPCDDNHGHWPLAQKYRDYYEDNKIRSDI